MNLLSYNPLPLTVAYLLLMLANEMQRATVGSDQSGLIHKKILRRPLQLEVSRPNHQPLPAPARGTTVVIPRQREAFLCRDGSNFDIDWGLQVGESSVVGLGLAFAHVHFAHAACQGARNRAKVEAFKASHLAPWRCGGGWGLRFGQT